MKKLPFILLALLFNLTAMGQIKIKTEKVNIILPVGVKLVNNRNPFQITMEQLQLLWAENTAMKVNF
jgi:hypothetical protein